MTELPQPPMPAFAPEPPAPKKPRTNLVIIGSAAAVIAAIVATGVVVAQTRDDGNKPTAAAKSSAPANDAVSAPDPTPSYDEVTADSFTIKLKTTKRHCFGSAGCNLTVEPDLTLLVDTADVDPAATYEITYEIHGAEDGPVIETAELSDQTSLNYTPSLIQTSSASKKVTVEITDVTAQGS